MLFWRQSIGLSLAIFAIAVMAAVWLIARPARAAGGKRLALIIGMGLLSIAQTLLQAHSGSLRLAD